MMGMCMLPELFADDALVRLSIALARAHHDVGRDEIHHDDAHVRVAGTDAVAPEEQLSFENVDQLVLGVAVGANGRTTDNLGVNNVYYIVSPTKFLLLISNGPSAPEVDIIQR